VTSRRSLVRAQYRPSRKPLLAQGFSCFWTTRHRRPLIAQETKLPRRIHVERGIYRNPSTGRLEIQYTDWTGRVRWKTVGGNLPQARHARAEAQAARRSFADVAEEWLASQTRLSPRTMEGYATSLDRHLLPRIGKRSIATIDEDVIVGVITELEAQGLAGWTIRNVLVPFGRVLTYAARHKLIPYNPMLRLERSERPRVARREMRILRSDEIDALLRATPLPYRPIIATAVFTGLRQGELLGLRWVDIDYALDLIHVRRQLDRNGQYRPPKTRRSHRMVVLNRSLAALLTDHQRASLWPEPTDPVFATASGRPMHWRNVTRRGLAVAIAEANLNNDYEPTLRFHDLRHTFAALLIAQGLSVVYVSRQLGHAYASFTLDNYGGLFDRKENGHLAAQGLEAAFPQILRQ
jgi:integrase